MRQLRIALFGLLVASSAFAQGNAPAPAQPPTGTPEQLAKVLADWEKAMTGVETLAVKLKRTDVNNTFKRTDTSTGVAHYMKLVAGATVQNLAIMHLENDARPKERWERYVSTGEFLYQYRPLEKKIYVNPLPPSKAGQVGDSSFLSFLFGMKADEAQKRYELTLQHPNDPNWVIVHVRPRELKDKQDFQQARLVLDKKTLLPKQLWFEQPTGDLTTWDLDGLQTNVKLDRTTFTAPDKPAGWEMIKVPPKGATEPAPRKAIP